MALSLSTQLENLERERSRLEELLMLDANWRALRDLDCREASLERVMGPASTRRRAELEQALKANRIYVARAKLMETIELLSGPHGFSAGSEAGKLASRIVMLSEPTGDTFRARLRLKPVEAREEIAGEQPVKAETNGEEAVQPPGDAAPAAMPDALMLIAGFGGRAVELLQDAGITRFVQIAGWSVVEAAAWRERLNGVAEGSSGWWIEQAAMLARGHATAFSSRVRRGEFAALVPAPDREPLLPVRHEAVNDGESASSKGAVSLPDADVIAPAADIGRSAKRTRLKSAEQIAMALAAYEAETAGASLPKPEAAPAAVANPAPPGAETTENRRFGPYSRPQGARHGAGIDRNDGQESEVTVVSHGEKRSLSSRLKDVADPHRFESATYAAYRGVVEEASVTIVRSGPACPKDAPQPTASPQAEGAPAQKSNRFLKALTGRE